MLYPLQFQPIFKERVWGGQKLRHLYKKDIPDTVPVGESWEISDRPGDVNCILAGPLAGKDLRWLMDNHRESVLGQAQPFDGRFPLLIKLLDAQEKLSLQVHPPAHAAGQLGGEPKTEMWVVTDAEPNAELFVGLKHGVSKDAFTEKLQTGSVAECFHRIPVKPGDAMFVPSGRVHAIGGGCVLLEVQQNSDTTFRVFDWNRSGLDGKPRQLHIQESLQCIDFEDYEPGLISQHRVSDGAATRCTLVDDPLFTVQSLSLESSACLPLEGNTAAIVAVLSGELHVPHAIHSPKLHPGEFALIPACIMPIELHAASSTEFLLIHPK